MRCKQLSASSFLHVLLVRREDTKQLKENLLQNCKPEAYVPGSDGLERQEVSGSQRISGGRGL